MSVLNQVRQVVLSPRGQLVLRRCRGIVKPVVRLVGMRRHHGLQAVHPDRDTVVVVTHEGSATGAPILALNLCKRLSEEANVVVISLRGGPLINDFQNYAAVVLQPRLGVVFSGLLKREIKRLHLGRTPRYALVNSVVSAGFVQPLRSIGIAPVCLIHEFTAYIRPIEILNDLGIWSSAMVFSSYLTRNDVLERCPQLQQVSMPVLPQGPCERPNRPGRMASMSRGSGDAYRFLDSLAADTILIIGAGEIQPRKGVDYFIAVADQIRTICGTKNVQFAWIGSGYSPQYDFSVSLWLEDQIKRSGLGHQLQILDHSPAYAELLERSDLFLMTSRLDPLPNVAIDAMLAGKPVLCYERACGIADFLLQEEDLGSALVAPYLNASAMASKAAHLIDHDPIRVAISCRIQEKASEWFNMDSYIEQLKILGRQAASEQIQHQDQLERLVRYNAIQPSWGFSKAKSSLRAGTEQYVLAWQKLIWPRKPFPGFHPGIYSEFALSNNRDIDPFLHFLDNHRPQGPWSPMLLSPTDRQISRKPLSSLSTALHIHVHYQDLLAEILCGLGSNEIRPDLYITTSVRDSISDISRLVESYGFSLKQVALVPNRGRDIGPLVTEIGKHLDANYQFYGHIHTKKSVLIGKDQSLAWRRLLLRNLLGKQGEAMADLIISSMTNDPQLGLVFPDDPTCVGWMGNRPIANELAERLGITTLPENFDFPVGTMFWTRQGVLTPLYKLGLTWDDYPSEPLGYDGTILHAIERLIPLLSTSGGYKYALTHIPGVTR